MAKMKQLSESLEDYLEAIYHLVQKGKVARSRDIARNLNVARASVTGALKLLYSKGLVDYQPYGLVTLTEKGLHLARAVVQRHQIIQSFFVNVLGVDESSAQQAACKAEHALGQTVISKIMNFTEFSEDYRRNGTDIVLDFQKYCQSKGV